MSLEPKKTGGPIGKFWDSSEIVTSLEIVKGWLGKAAKKYIASDPPTAKYLAQLISQLIQFQDDHLGKGAKQPPFLRLPMRHFYNFMPDGSLGHILATMYRFKSDQGWRRFDLTSPSRRDMNMEMCREIRAALVDKELEAAPKLFLSKALSKEDREKVERIAKKRDMALVEDEESATHVLHPPHEVDDGYARPVFKKGERCLVHFYRFPESRDNWGPLYPPEDRDPPEFGGEIEREEQYHVGADWLYEVEEYNELLVEDDFMTDEKGEPVNHELLLNYDEFTASEEKPKKKSKKRGRSPSPTPSKGDAKAKKGGRA